MGSRTAYGVIIGKLDCVITVSECDRLIEAVYEHKRFLIEKRGANDGAAKSAIKAHWKKYRDEYLVSGETAGGGGGLKCKFCNRKATAQRFEKFFYFSTPTPALHNGQSIVVRACCQQCHQELTQRYEKELEWLQQQQEELKIVKRIASMVSREVSQLHKKELRRAKSSPVS